MIEESLLPEINRPVLGSERKEFAVIAGKAQQSKMFYFLIFFGIIWLASKSIYVIALLESFFMGKEIE